MWFARRRSVLRNTPPSAVAAAALQQHLCNVRYDVIACTALRFQETLFSKHLAIGEFRSIMLFLYVPRGLLLREALFFRRDHTVECVFCLRHLDQMVRCTSGICHVWFEIGDHWALWSFGLAAASARHLGTVADSSQAHVQ